MELLRSLEEVKFTQVRHKESVSEVYFQLSQIMSPNTTTGRKLNSPVETLTPPREAYGRP